MLAPFRLGGPLGDFENTLPVAAKIDAVVAAFKKSRRFMLMVIPDRNVTRVLLTKVWNVN
jgi:hypothetical protein